MGQHIGIVSVMGFWVCALAFAQVSGRWSTGAPMPSARSEVAVAEVAGKVYVVGGFGGDTPLEIYEPTADRWSRGAPLPRPLHHAAAVGVDGWLFVLGGYADGWTPVDSVYEYSPAMDRWRNRAALPTARGALAATVINGKIHVVGGITWPRPRSGGGPMRSAGASRAATPRM